MTGCLLLIYLLGLTKRFGYEEINLPIFIAVFILLLTAPLYRRRIIKNCIKRLLAILQESERNQAYIDKSIRNSTYHFEVNSQSAYYTFKVPVDKNRPTVLKSEFLLKNDSSQKTWNSIIQATKQFQAEYPDTIQLKKRLLFNNVLYCFISIEHNLSSSQLIRFGRFLKEIEKNHLHPVEDYFSFHIPTEKVTYYVQYSNGVAVRSLVKDAEGSIWDMEIDVLDDIYRDMQTLNKQMKSEKIAITPCSREEFKEIENAVVCEIDYNI